VLYGIDSNGIQPYLERAADVVTGVVGAVDAVEAISAGGCPSRQNMRNKTVTSN